MTFIPDKPQHRRFSFRNLNDTQYKTYARQYSKAKVGGIRCVYSWASGMEVMDIVSDVSKGVVFHYGKRKFGVLCLTIYGYVCSPAVLIITNATKIVKSVHSICAFGLECVEDSSNLVFLSIDFALFGQPIPIGASDRFNLFLKN